jgi:hypothetical protein
MLVNRKYGVRLYPDRMLQAATDRVKGSLASPRTKS